MTYVSYFKGSFTRPRAARGNALLPSLCIAVQSTWPCKEGAFRGERSLSCERRCGTRGRASKTVCSQAEPGNKKKQEEQEEVQETNGKLCLTTT